MILECLPYGMFDSNCYIIGQDGWAAVIDPGCDAAFVLEVLEKHGLKARYILLTHGHIDHMCSVDALKEALDAPVLIHREDAELLTDSRSNGSILFGKSRTFQRADKLLDGGEKLQMGELQLEIIHTPGHTPGCICIKAGNCIFSGDTVFKGSIGRTDLPGGNYEKIIVSVTELLSSHNDDVMIYPGHGESTTVGFEKKNNPFVKNRL